MHASVWPPATCCKASVSTNQTETPSQDCDSSRMYCSWSHTSSLSAVLRCRACAAGTDVVGYTVTYNVASLLFTYHHRRQLYAMSVLPGVMEALQVISARGITESKAAQSYSSLSTILTVLSEHPMDDSSIDDAAKAFTGCIALADKLCGMQQDATKCLGLSALGTAMQNCPRKLFLAKFPDVWHSVNTLARGNRAEAAATASDALVQMLKRLHTFMAAQGVKTIAAQPVAQIVVTALQLLRSGPVLVGRGLGLLESVLECMPQAARSQFEAACVACHTLMADVQLSLELRLQAARVLAALPASQNSSDAQSQHLQGLLIALHTSLSTIPAPVTDFQASRVAGEALGDKLQGCWKACVMVPPATAPHHVPPQQRLDAISILIECLTETLSRSHVPSIAVPVSPAILLVSRLVAHRPLHVPFSEEQFTAPERAQLLLCGAKLLKSGVILLIASFTCSTVAPFVFFGRRCGVCL